MRVRHAAAIAGVAAARAVLAFVLSLAFWAAAPAAWGWLPTSVMTASMSPAIEVGDVVVSRPADATALVPGRVVLADDPDHPDRWRLHRVDGVRPDGVLVTKGDANPTADSSPVRPETVHGVGFLRVPWVGWPVVWARSGNAVALTAVVLGILLCLLVAGRRGADDDCPIDDGPTDETPTDPPPNTDEQRPRGAPQTRRSRRALGLASAVVALMALGTSPAWAALAASTSTTASISAARVPSPSPIGCHNPDGAEIRWGYDGPSPRGFSLLVNGEVVRSDIPGSDRSASLPFDRYYSIFTRARVTVRAEVGRNWTATSASSVEVGGILFGFGRPFCV